MSARAAALPSIQVSSVAVSDLYLIAVGGFSPLTGFMGKADYESVRDTMHLANGAAWSLPVTLSASREAAKSYVGKSIALTDEGGSALAVMDVTEAFDYDKQDEARKALQGLERDDLVYISVDVDPNERAEDLARYADDYAYPWHFVVASAEVARSLADTFGPQVLSPPSTPKIILDPDGSASLSFGIRGAADLRTDLESRLR